MKKILLWIAGILLVIIAVAIALAIAGSSVFLSDDEMMGKPRELATGVMRQDGITKTRMMENAPGSPVTTYDFDATVKQDNQRLVIRTAEIAIVSQDVERTVEALKKFTDVNGGFVVTATVQGEEGSPPSAVVSFRIPASKLDTAVEYVRKQAVKVARESITGEDVTEEYVDVNAKIRNLQASETQFLSILKDARKTEDVLTVYREIERVRGDIDSYTARKQYLEKSAELSSVSVTIATDEASLPVVESGNEWRPLVVAKGAVTAFLATVMVIAYTAIWIVIFLPLWGTVYLIVRIMKRRHADASPPNGKKR